MVFSCVALRINRRFVFEDRYSSSRAIAFIQCTRAFQLVGMAKIEGRRRSRNSSVLTDYDKFDFFFITSIPDKAGETETSRRRKAIEDSTPRCDPLQKKLTDAITVTTRRRVVKATRASAAVLLHSAVSGSDKLDRFTETGANVGSLACSRRSISCFDAGERESFRQVRA